MCFWCDSFSRDARGHDALVLGIRSVWLAFLHEESSGWIYAAAILNGAGSSTIMVTSVAMEADLIGKNIGSGAP
jgi:hypothetical protein